MSFLDAREKWTPNACSPPLKKDEGMAITIMALLKEFLPKHSRVLDLGCGIGRFAQLFTEWMNYLYLGVDQSKEMIEEARRLHPFLPFRIMNAMDMPVKKVLVPFGLVFSCAVLQHNRHEDKDKIIPKIREALKPDGLFLMFENTFTKENYHYALGGGAPGHGPIPKDTPFTKEFTDGYSFTSEGWDKYISAFGFKLLKHDRSATLYLFQRL